MAGASFAPMTRLDFSTYLQHIRDESARFRAALVGSDPAARVPSCPDWDATDLMWHLGAGVQGFWADVIEQRPEGPAEGRTDPERPATFEEALTRFDLDHGRLVAALEVGRPGRSSLDLVDGTDGRLHLPAAGARGPDPPRGRRADGGDARRGTRSGAVGRRRRRDACRHVRGMPAMGHLHASPPARADRAHRRRGVALGAARKVHRHPPRRTGRPTTRTTSTWWRIRASTPTRPHTARPRR